MFWGRRGPFYRDNEPPFRRKRFRTPIADAIFKAKSGNLNLFLGILLFFPCLPCNFQGKKGKIRRKRFRLPDFAFFADATLQDSYGSLAEWCGRGQQPIRNTFRFCNFHCASDTLVNPQQSFARKALLLPARQKPCPSFPWCFCFLGIFAALDFLGFLKCFLLILQGFTGI